MHSKKTAVILAGGLGSRYKGLKQVDGILENGATIMEYSIYDALQAGFNSFVIVINRLIPDTFKKKIEENLFAHSAELHWVIQEPDDFLPENYSAENRLKPWGTAHAVLCAGKAVKGNFIIINADDFYGKEIYRKAAHLMNSGKITDEHGAMIAFPVGGTVSESGTVSRGVCHLNSDGTLKEVEEHSINQNAGKIFCVTQNGNDEIDSERLVSMNFWVLNEAVFSDFNRIFQEFLTGNPKETDEFQLPRVIQQLIDERKLKISVEKSPSSWKGVTYPEDKEALKIFLSDEISKNRYPENLWS